MMSCQFWLCARTVELTSAHIQYPIPKATKKWKALSRVLGFSSEILFPMLCKSHDMASALVVIQFDIYFLRALVSFTASAARFYITHSTNINHICTGLLIRDMRNLNAKTVTFLRYSQEMKRFEFNDGLRQHTASNIFLLLQNIV